MAEFFTRDPAHLVPFHDLILCCKAAQELQIEKDNYHYKELRDTIKKGQTLQASLREYVKNPSRNYKEAKFFYAEHIGLGVQFHETRVIRELVDPNIALEKLLTKPIDKPGLIKL